MVSEYKQVPGHPSYYLDRDGNLWHGPKNRKLKQTINKGQATVTPDRKFRQVARLMLETFHGPAPDPSWHARHLDGDTLNNGVDNLAWFKRGEAPAQFHAVPSTDVIDDLAVVFIPKLKPKSLPKPKTEPKPRQRKQKNDPVADPYWRAKELGFKVMPEAPRGLMRLCEQFLSDFVEIEDDTLT